ncbi:MAG: PLP-dependent aminotransferase family protein [Proteobacteria bacterium]|nr:MAG: PLP-dependent aminotransferase family protein [Pseudomonadota bacterium]
MQNGSLIRANFYHIPRANLETVTDYLGLRLDGEGALHRQLYRALRHAILAGHLSEGSRLPATRALARDLRLSRNTVLLVFEQLTAEGYLAGRTGSGTYVASPLPEAMLAPEALRDAPPAATAEPRWSRFAHCIRRYPPAAPRSTAAPRYDFRYGAIDAEPRLLDEWRKRLGRAAQHYPVDYADPRGDPGLRAAIARYVSRSRGCHCTAGQIVVTSGSQQALDLIARLLLDAGDRVAIENPGYLGARNAFLNAGAELMPAGVDTEGLIVDQLPATARLVYTTPSHQFPTGAVLSLRRRLALLEWAQNREAWIVEDDYDGEYRYEGRPVEAVQGLDRPGRTLYVGTFSKVLFPAARLGYVILPESMLDTFAAAKWWTDRHTPVLEQRVLADFLDDGEFERHLRRMRKRYALRRTALIDALRRHFGEKAEITGTQAGLHLMVRLKDYSSGGLKRLIDAAREKGIGLYSAAPLYLAPHEAPPCLLMGYATLAPEEIQKAIEHLASIRISETADAAGG